MERRELIRNLKEVDACVYEMERIIKKCPKHYATGMPRYTGEGATLAGFGTLSNCINTAIQSGALADETRIYVDGYGNELGREYSAAATNSAIAVGTIGLGQKLMFDLFKINSDAHAFRPSIKDKMKQVKDVAIGFAFVIGGSLISATHIPVISTLLCIGLCLFGWYWIIKKGVIGYERLKETRLEENDARYINLVQQLMSNTLVATNMLNADCLQHRILVRFIKQLESGAAQTLANCR